MLTCNHCGLTKKQEANFCPHCGEAYENIEAKNGSNTLNLIISFYVVTMLFLTLYYFLVPEEMTLIQTIVIESLFPMLMIAFACYDYKDMIKLYIFPKQKNKLFALVLLAPFFTAFAVYYLMAYVNEILFFEEANYYLDYVGFEYPMLWGVLFVAVFPAIFEELGFRGFLFNQLSKITSVKVTIVLTAFIFALIHLSLLSVFWIFPFGLLLGYVRNKTNSLWYGMMIHFIHNFIVLMLDYREYIEMISIFE